MLSTAALVSKWTPIINPSDDSAPQVLGDLFAGQVEERAGSGEALFWEGDAARDLFQLTRGVLRMYRILSDGRRVITGFLYPGDMVGLSLRDRYLYTAEAVTDVAFRRLGRRRFDDELIRHPALRSALVAAVCKEMAAVNDQMVLLARKTAAERVCSFLIDIGRRVDAGTGGVSVELPMTRLDMADYLGLTIETVSRIMTKLARSRVIAAAGRHGIRIVDQRRLTELAGEIEELSARAAA